MQISILLCFCFTNIIQGFLMDRSLDETPNLENEKVCSGTHMGFSYSGSLRRHYRSMRRRYTGCTYIYGNLEITHLRHKNIKYDLSFLRTIRYVSGYVLVAMTTRVREIPLTNLELIRGNRTVTIYGRNFSLVVSLTSGSFGSRRGLQELQMPKLKEISEGNVLFSDNPGLCYVQTILWEDIIRGGKRAMLLGPQPLARYCLPCSSYCLQQDGFSRCWGQGKGLCQKLDLKPYECSPNCPFRCYGPGKYDCCHDQCAGDCSGNTQYDCQMCKNYDSQGKCVGWCSFEEQSFARGQTCWNL